ncbi:MAG: hypothetical protein MK169_03055 [Candidatus Thalassarchaeum sp.]|nr:hypothetical protein [Candidatus Thalassarchaeum sp.]MCS5531798.1 hypothetical protein [Candidatus Poseidoniales archaeon]MEC8939149.1 hypothetical protein [Candidatus Thermoplasmatota archaeon]MEC8955253.1 hypothetical protein [Candidatus Thermoplasmatota archaeon]MEC9350810.1 hypothetical protein [Candidatus Thermoplasmatota archaeon]|tara:strand:- start:8136 stop:8486 length:351 start_codon:yes stop_codon:yes gene_type:complete
MVRSIEVKKASVRARLIVDVDVFMNDPDDFDFSPRASMDGNSLSITNAGADAGGSIDLDDEQMNAAERDRMVELRVKFSVDGMHGILTHKTKNTRIAPNAKKLAEPRWKTVLPLSM